MVELPQAAPPAALPQAGTPASQSPAPEDADLFGDYSPAVTVASAVILMLAISVIDRLTGFDLYVAILHLVPIAMVTWALGRAWGLGLAAVALVPWYFIFRGEHHYVLPIYFYVDAAVLGVTFVTFVLLIGRLREALRAHELSFAILDKLDAPAYIVDLQTDVVLLGNREFRAAFEGRPAEELAQYPAQEAHFTLGDGRPALLRILAL